MAKKQANLKKTIRQLAYAMVESVDETTGKITYGEIKYLSLLTGGREWDSDPVGDSMEVDADGYSVYSEDQNGGYDITLTTVAASDNIETDWYGKQEDSDGITEFADGKEWNHFALFIYEDTTDGVGIINFFGDCHIKQRNGDSGRTSEGGTFDPIFPEHTIACRPRLEDNFVMKKIKGKQKLTSVPTITRADAPEATSYINSEDE